MRKRAAAVENIPPTLTAERVSALLDYDQNSGEFTWKVRRNSVKAGSKAGSKTSHGYVSMMIDGRNYYAHRLAWLITYGDWPEEHVDHINLDRSDNRIDNLRECSHADNQLNRRLNARNTSGFPGVSWCSSRQRWQAHIGMDGRSIGLGRFDTPEAAHAAYLDAKERLHAPRLSLSRSKDATGNHDDQATCRHSQRHIRQRSYPVR